MKRYNTYITIHQLSALRLLSQETGLAVAELLRRAIDEYLAPRKAFMQEKEGNAQGSPPVE